MTSEDVIHVAHVLRYNLNIVSIEAHKQIKLGSY